MRSVAKWYLFYLGFVLSTELITETLILGFNNQNISFLYPFYISSEFFALSNMFILSLGLSNKWRSITSILSLALFVEAVILWSHNQFFTPGFGKIISHLTIICLSGHLLIKNLKELEIYNPFIIIYAALFLYYAVSLFLFLLMNQLDNVDYNTASIIWSMNNILSSILYGASIYTFYQLKKSH